MNRSPEIAVSRQIWHFIVHLRWHYQVFILSGGFLMGGFFQDTMDWKTFLIQFLNVHLLLFGGATAFNSWWDKDEGAVGGLRHPPKMRRWMWFASLLLQAIGLFIAIPSGRLFTGIYALSMFFFWLYSTPLARWKSRPVRSLTAIGISTGANSFLLGYLAAGNTPVGWDTLIAAAGVALVILSLYPASQIYQLEEDKKRGDHTFAVRFGIRGVLTFYRCAFFSGITLIALALGFDHSLVGGGFFLVGLATGLWVWKLLKGLVADTGAYDRVMRIKYGTSLAFVLVLITGIVVKHLIRWA